MNLAKEGVDNIFKPQNKNTGGWTNKHSKTRATVAKLLLKHGPGYKRRPKQTDKSSCLNPEV